MSFRQLTGYLDMMLSAQLLLIENNGPHLLFRISGKGKDFLKAYESLKSLMEQPSLSIDRSPQSLIDRTFQLSNQEQNSDCQRHQ
jgi:hypothetical protein